MNNIQKRILVCDDDLGIAEVMEIILSENGYQVKVLTSGKGIEKKILGFQPDLIFLDIWMPGIDGKEITKVLKRTQEFKKIPIILISALSDGERICKNVGADGFLAKPFEISDLLATIQKYI